ncbi:Uncharacterised protein [Shigella sonnei]|nr:Uncharacterised protein [Shigella sonnei]CSP99682.1 Uncharacterised protein [Shigella sonnei]
MLHTVEHFRNKPGAFIQRDIAHRIATLRQFRASRVQQMAAPRAFACPEIDVTAMFLTQHVLQRSQ